MLWYLEEVPRTSMSTHNLCFCGEIIKIFTRYCLLSGAIRINEMANSADSDQTGPKRKFLSGSLPFAHACLSKHTG